MNQTNYRERFKKVDSRAVEYSNDLVHQVRELLSWGFNSVEIAEKLQKHEVSIRTIKLGLKKIYTTSSNKPL